MYLNLNTIILEDFTVYLLLFKIVEHEHRGSCERSIERMFETIQIYVPFLENVNGEESISSVFSWN